MKNLIEIAVKRVFIVFFISLNTVYAQDTTTVTVKKKYSENLDLKVVASLFGEAKDLEDFEKKLNDPETKASNLDLNGDSVVDYLRVIETSKKKTHVVTVQAVIGEDKYQDVACIDVEKDKEGNAQVQVVGDTYIYGSNYIVEPVYVATPTICVWFWGPYYSPWVSPYYWGYYPPYYSPWYPYPYHYYHRSVSVHVNVNHSYSFTSVRRSKTSIDIQNKNRRNDFERKQSSPTRPDRGNVSKEKAQNKGKKDGEMKSKASNRQTTQMMDKRPTQSMQNSAARDRMSGRPNARQGGGSFQPRGNSRPSRRR